MGDKFKNKTNDAIAEMNKRLGEGAKIVGKKVGELAEAGKIKIIIYSLNQKIKECKMKIGDIVYKEKKEEVDSEIKKHIEEIDKLYKEIDKEKEKMKNINGREIE